MDCANTPRRLFEGFGVELEYMIVEKETMAVRAIADEVLRAVTGEYAAEALFPQVCWSNEISLHVIELKTNGPAASLTGLHQPFQDHVCRINDILRPLDAMLLPTGAHPFMNPYKEMRLWPHQDYPIYAAYNKIFDCRGHGWANLQSTHINLPFASDEEFGRLHAAIRLILPLIPALAASTPILDGQATGFLDTRLEKYRTIQAKIRSITGRVVPEAVFTAANYQTEILQRMYQDIAPYDPEGILQEEWLNSRGAIPRFDRDAIEIRLLDIQEAPVVDMAVMITLVQSLKAMIAERWISWEEQKRWNEERLEQILLALIRDAGDAMITDLEYLNVFGLSREKPCLAQELWAHVINDMALASTHAEAHGFVQKILRSGCLAKRIVRAIDKDLSLEKIKHVYRQLAECLQHGCLFEPV